MLSQSFTFNTKLKPSEIEERIKNLYAESTTFNKAKYSGYFDKDYFKLNDKEYSRLGEPATVEGKILKSGNHTIIEITLTPTEKTVLQLTFALLILIVVVSLTALSIVPLPKRSTEALVIATIAVIATFFAIRMNYYSLKNTIVETLQLEYKHEK